MAKLQADSNCYLILSSVGEYIHLKVGSASLSINSDSIKLSAGTHSLEIDSAGKLYVNGVAAFGTTQQTVLIDTPWSTKTGRMEIYNGIITYWTDDNGDETEE